MLRVIALAATAAVATAQDCPLPDMSNTKPDGLAEFETTMATEWAGAEPTEDGDIAGALKTITTVRDASKNRKDWFDDNKVISPRVCGLQYPECADWECAGLEPLTNSTCDEDGLQAYGKSLVVPHAAYFLVGAIVLLILIEGWCVGGILSCTASLALPPPPRLARVSSRLSACKEHARIKIEPMGGSCRWFVRCCCGLCGGAQPSKGQCWGCVGSPCCCGGGKTAADGTKNPKRHDVYTGNRKIWTVLLMVIFCLTVGCAMLGFLGVGLMSPGLTDTVDIFIYKLEQLIVTFHEVLTKANVIAESFPMDGNGPPDMSEQSCALADMAETIIGLKGNFTGPLEAAAPPAAAAPSRAACGGPILVSRAPLPDTCPPRSSGARQPCGNLLC